MGEKDIIMLNQKELRRIKVIQEVSNKHITQKAAASLLSLSERQIRRLTGRFLKEGDLGLIHSRRGKPSNRKLPQEIKDKVINLYKKKYPGFGPTLAGEKLSELDKINIGTQTLRNWLIAEGLWKKRRKIRPHRQWRERCECFGQMIQVDGSHHPWLEERGEELVLMTYIDDATGHVFARFYSYEGTFPAMDSFKRYVKKYGLPQSIYVDKHSTYKSQAKPTIEDELEGRKPLSQFERALEELGVRIIHAHSPQAKGRVERVLRTLQDRLVKEMRLKGIKTKEEANLFLEQYLPLFNQRFSLEPKNPTDLHRNIDQRKINLEAILCLKTKRVLRNDLTLMYQKTLFQILEIPQGARIKYVTVEERLNGKIYLSYNGFKLKYRKIESRPEKLKEPTKPRKIYIPSRDHPWRKFRFGRSSNFEYAEEKEEALV